MKIESRPLTKEAKDAADHLLAAVGPMGMREPQHEIAGRAGAAIALIADNANARLRALDLPPEVQAETYLRSLGGGLGMTIKLQAPEARAAVAATVFFFMLDFLGHRAGSWTANEMITEFTGHLLRIRDAELDL